MAQSKMYKLPVPELLEPANAPLCFENLARAIEGQAYPSLQAWDSFTTDMFQPLNRNNSDYVLYSEQIPSNGIVGWIDVDAYCIAAIGYPPDGTAGTMGIRINDALVAVTRYHNFWVGQNMPVYTSTRWSNPGGIPARVTVDIWLDNDATPAQVLLSTGMSYQVYGAKVF